MSDNYVLDTGIANLVAMNEANVSARLAFASRVYLSVVTLGELYAGAYIYAHRHQSVKLLDRYDALVARYRDALLICDDDTIGFYGAISGELIAKGNPMQQNDVWIAALTRQHGLTLVTLDSDFLRISDLDVEIWR